MSVKESIQSMESRIRLEEIRMLHGGMMFSILGTFAVSLIMFFVLYKHASSTLYLALWFGIMMLSSLLRGWDTYCFINASPDEQVKESWGTRFLIGSTFAGFWWGMLAWLGYSVENEYQTLIVVCIVGVAGGSLATLSYRWQTIVFFIMPALLLLELRLMLENSDFTQVLSYLLAVFILFALSTSRRAYKNSNQNVKLRIEADYNEKALREAKNEAEQANAAKSTFLSNMSHELRTPLHAILGYAQLLEHGDALSQKQSCNIGEIKHAGNLLLDLVNQILDLAGIEEGNLNISMASIALDEVLKECKSLVQPLADEKNIYVDITDTTIQVHADYIRLKQAILNLLTNGIKYNYNNGSVIIKCYHSDNNRVRIDVIDTGRGISREQQVLLFKPFSRLDPEGEIEGTGIGLSISRQLIEKMHGTIKVESDIGKGSTFSIELDSHLPEDDVTEDVVQCIDNNATIQSVKNKDNLKILVVEDSLPNLRMIEYQLEVLGYKADLATDGNEALQLFRNNHYGLIITDCNMPIMNGYELTSIIRNEDKSDIPIVALTADAFPEREEQCLAAGMNARLIKPMSLEVLNAAIDQWLSNTLPGKLPKSTRG
ncbi:MAG: ATP-binding protein [Gammaproteobacteria bacterium]|nr:ATP-binding protein [Gammaproteobacteria bacterium]